MNIGLCLCLYLYSQFNKSVHEYNTAITKFRTIKPYLISVILEVLPRDSCKTWCHNPEYYKNDDDIIIIIIIINEIWRIKNNDELDRLIKHENTVNHINLLAP